MTRTIPPSELIINPDGTIFHLHLRPDQIAHTIILVGDPDRVDLVASHFDTIEHNIHNREFHTITGTHRHRRITCLSHGIGCDNIDIVATELDALANIDLTTRTILPHHTTLTLIRIGTSGSLQDTCPVGTYVASEKSIGFDGLLNYYHTPDGTFDTDMTQAFIRHTQWNPLHATPYIANADPELLDRLAYDMTHGITISAPGFYGPQGRHLRARPADPHLNEKIITFRHNGHPITNFEMESSALAGMAALLGHKAITICAIIAGRIDHNIDTTYHHNIDHLITTILSRL